jgi:hypothetical protein
MPRIVKVMMKFCVVFFAATIICTVLWQYTAADLYDCTDDGFPPGYLAPGWIHDLPQQSIKTVPQVVHGRSMSEPDTIKEGWDVPRLWRLWYAFFVTSLVASFTFAWVPWGPRHQTKQANEPSSTAA